MGIRLAFMEMVFFIVLVSKKSSFRRDGRDVHEYRIDPEQIGTYHVKIGSG